MMLERRTFLAAFSALGLPLFAAADRQISMAALRDKIAGGWVGQMIGVSYGEPTEFRYRNEMIPLEKLPVWKPELISRSLNQDDLYVDMTLAKVLDEKGLDATTADFATMFRQAKYQLWHANLAARRALLRDVPASLSGTPKYNAHYNDIDFQIEADFIGLMSPGQFQSSNEICLRAGRVMNEGDGIYGGVFVSAMYAAAFFESNPLKLVETGLAAVPSQSLFAKTIAATLEGFRKYPNDWTKTWQLLEDKFNNREQCSDGALRPFNIDARLNAAYIAIGLLYGQGDFEQTMILSTRCGQDSDCNPSSACGVLGVVRGYEQLPKQFTSGVAAIRDKKFSFTDYTFDSIVDSTVKRAVALVLRNGGERNGEALTVRLQTVKAAPFQETETFGSPAERIAVTDARWTFSGAWRPEKNLRVATQKDATATVSFTGSGFVLVGPYLPDGGKADIFVDGKFAATRDVYPDEDHRKSAEVIYHEYGLKNGAHTVKLVVRGERYGESTGTAIGIEDLVVLR